MSSGAILMRYRTSRIVPVFPFGAARDAPDLSCLTFGKMC
jgi:hypothetical protein